ncbi:amidohydrolase family protein [Microbacterium esteraromaticum]|uniref:amidohydrolase n=1 Tax=Microbacterium esteraromaticum TaxID=57043 RepID=UPI0023680288|nr:amidohydrolase family protein [Microbacterium esteraromaticum]WDH77563.1 amidohydrolase family protein [Microbacterium esteraromaticum]
MTARGDRIDVVRAVRLTGPAALAFGDEPVDLMIERGRIADIAPTGDLAAHGVVLDGHGSRVLPGLWDHHVHTVQWALDAERVQLGEVRSAAEAARLMGAAAPLSDGRVVGAGMRDALWLDAPSLAVIDAACGDRPTYLINMDVHSVWLNSAAFRREGFAPTPDGMLREEDAFEISRRLNTADDAMADAAVRRAGERAASRGVTGIVDFDMAWNADAWQRRADAGFDAHRVEFAFYAANLQRAIDAGLRTGNILGGTDDLVHVGPLKLITDGSLGTRTAACSHAYGDDPQNFGEFTIDPEQLRDYLTTATGAGIEVAVHAIGDRAVASALDAFTYTQARGTIEHAQLVRHADLARFARLGVVASVQPTHAVDDRDLVGSLWQHQSAISHPVASLMSADVAVRFGSDAPVAPLDPWVTIAAAVHRTGDERAPWHPEEQVPIGTALRASSRHGMTDLEIGGTADLVICSEDPLTADRESLRRMPVAATLLGGRLTHLG